MHLDRFPFCLYFLCHRCPFIGYDFIGDVRFVDTSHAPVVPV